jgi:hypothetical protein
MRTEPIEEWDQRRKRVSTKRADITGQKFHRLTALRPVARSELVGIVWLCRCDCGGERTATVGNLRNGNTKSCGCLSVGLPRRLLTVGGVTRGFSEWCAVNGINFHTAYSRVLNGWPVEKAVTLPPCLAKRRPRPPTGFGEAELRAAVAAALQAGRVEAP